MTHELSQLAKESPGAQESQTFDPRDAAIAYFGGLYQALAARHGSQSAQARRAWEFTLQATRGELALSLTDATNLVLGVHAELGTVANQEIPLSELAASATAGTVELVLPASPAE